MAVYIPCQHLRLESGRTFRKGDYVACCAPIPAVDLSAFPIPVQKSWQYKGLRDVLLRDARQPLGFVCKDDCAKCPCYTPMKAGA